MHLHLSRSIGFSLLLAVTLTTLTSPYSASAAAAPDPAAKQRQLLAVLQSDAPPQEKAITCKQLAIYGNAEAVPTLAPLLADAQLASWARIALEVIPGPAADAALRDAMAKLQGRLLVGVINSIGVRRDEKAVKGLTAKLQDADPQVAAAAAVALGQIGGSSAAKALTRALKQNSSADSSAVAEGCVRCAAQWLAQGEYSKAKELYDTVRAAKVPRQRLLEATRGAILARRSAGLPLLLEQLRSPDKAFFGIGLTTARELPGREVTEALAAELRRASPERQPLLLLALADRGDAAAKPAILVAAGSGSSKLRVAAIRMIERQGDLADVPVLLDAATSNDADVAQAAKGALTRTPGSELDADLLARFPNASGKTRLVLVELVRSRSIEAGIPAVSRLTQNSDPAVRSAALQTLGAIGQESQLEPLVKLLGSTTDAKDREDIDAALRAISGRKGPSAVKYLLPLVQSSDDSLRITGLRALASAGGPDALAAVVAAADAPQETVQDEAVRTLSTWPNTWPEDTAVAAPLLALAKSGKKLSHQVLAVRGYLQYIEGDKKLKAADKLTHIRQLIPLLKRPEEKRLAMAAIDAIPTPDALALLVTFLEDPQVVDDAALTIANFASRDTGGMDKEARQKALQSAAEKTTNEATKQKAQEALKRLK